MKLIVLTFHGVEGQGPSLNIKNDNFAGDYTLDYVKFERIIKIVSSRKCYTVSEILNAKDDGIALTFDDGLISDYKIVSPILNKYDLTASFFVTANNIDINGYCSISQLKEMYNAGMEIGSHGLNHKYLTEMSKEEASSEICDSKTELEDKLGFHINAFAPVGGHYRTWMVRKAKEAGYSVFATMRPGITNPTNGFNILKRNHLKKDYNLDYINDLLSGEVSLIYKNILRYYFLLAPKVILGLTLYDKLKAQMLGRSI